jgi:multidrug efflux pump subunit AcrA (membrane-fusion protein)
MSPFWLKIKEKIGFIKTKKKYLIVFTLVVAGAGYWLYYKQNQAKAAEPRYVVSAAEKSTLVASLSGTGQVVALNKVDLKPSGSGIVTQVKAKLNTHVKAGDVLVILDQRSASASVAQARASVASAEANYQKLVSGMTPLEKATYEPQIASAEADYVKAQTDASSTIKTAELSLQTAENNLKQATGGDSSEVVLAAYQDTVNLLQGLLPKFNDLLTQADNILGLDNTVANQDFKQYLGLLNQTYLNQAYSNYTYAKSQVAQTRSMVEKLDDKSSQKDVDDTLASAEEALRKIDALLTSVSDTLNSTYPIGTLTATTLDSKKSSINNARTSVASARTSITNQKQALNTAKNSLSNYQIEYDKAVQNLAQAKANAESNIRSKELSLKQVQNNFDLKNQPASAADLAVARAQIANALAQLQSAENQYQNNIYSHI